MNRIERKIIVPSAESETYKRLKTIKHKGKPFEKLQKRTQANFLLVIHDLLTRGHYHGQLERRKPRATKVPCSKTHWLDLIGDAQRFVIPSLEKAGIIKQSPAYSNQPSKTKSGKAFGKSCKLMKELFADEWEFTTVKAKPQEPKQKKEKKSETCAEMERVTIDKAAALDALDEIAEDRGWNVAKKLSVYLQIESFDDENEISWARTGREFNKVNMLPKNLRKFLLVDGDSELEVLDVKSCSARIMAGWMKYVDQGEVYETLERKPCEKWAWNIWLDLGFYEKLVEHSGGKLKDRKQAKLDFCMFTGGSTRTQSAKIIAEHFPKFAKKLEDIQASCSTKGEVQRRIQMEESALFVDRMGEEEFFAASLHDGVLIKSCDLAEAQRVIAEVFPNAGISQEAA